MPASLRLALAALLSACLSACGSGSSTEAGPAPVDPARSTLSASPSQATADGAATVTITAVARDASGNALAGRAAIFTAAGSASLSAPSATTGADGAARVTLTSTLAGAKDVSVVVDGVAVTRRASPSFVAGPPAAVTFAAQPASGTAGAAFGVAVKVEDAHGNAVGSTQVGLALQGGTAGAVLAGIATATTDADGSAAFPGLSVAKAGAAYALVATSGAAQATSASFDVAAGAPSVGAGGASTTTPPPGPLTVGSAGSVAVTVVDEFGNPVPGVTVTFGTTGGTLSATTATTDAGGQAAVTSSSTAAGDVTVAATVNGQTVGQPAMVTFRPGPAASLQLAGLDASVTAGATSTVTVAARDAYGNVATSYLGTVHFSSTDPAAALPADVAFSGADGGQRSVQVDLRTAGARSIAAADVAAPAVTGSASTTVGPAAAASLRLAGLGSPWTAGTAGTPTVTAVDPYGNVATGYLGTVHFTSSDTRGALPADHAFQMGDAGRRTFTNGVTLTTAGAQSVTVADAGNAALTATAGALQVVPAAAAALTFAVQPTPTVAGSLLSPAVEVVARDAFGNAVTAPLRIDLTLQGGPAGAILAGTRTATAVGGSATFADLSVLTAGTGFALVASSSGLAGATSGAFSVTAGRPDAVASDVAAAPGSLVAGGTSTITATVRDPYGNAVPDVAVTLSATGADNTLVQPAAATGADGVATGSLSSTRAEAKTVAASAGALALAARPTVTFTAGAPSAAGSTLVASPISVSDDGTVVALAATVVDAYGNPVAGQAVTFSSSGAATFAQPASATGPDGTASGGVSALASGTQTISASVGGTVVAQADVAFTTAPPSASESTVAVSPASVPADGASIATATVSVKDGLGRAVSGATVALACSAAAVIAPASAMTDASGVATFAVTSTTVGSGTLVATVSPGGGQVILTEQPALAFVTPTYSVGGVVFDLSGDGLVLSTAGQPDLAVPAGSGSFAFATKVPSGTSYAVAIKTQPGTQTCSVFDGSGTVGSGDVTGVMVSCGLKWKKIVASGDSTFGITTDGRLYAWGSNDSGKLGDGTTTARRIPVLVGTGYASVAAGQNHAIALTTAGDIYTWGYNAYGELGDGTTTSRLTRTRVGSGYALVAAGGFNSYAITTGGDLYAWGENLGGKIGDGTTTQRNVPTLIGSGYATVAAGSNGSRFAITTGGQLYGWGNNGNGQLGVGDTGLRYSPTFVGSGYASVASSASHTAAITTGGELYAWGWNGSGQLGDGTTTQRITPTLVGSGYASVATGNGHTVALTTAGQLHAWGDNAYGQLGDGTTTQRLVPAMVGSGYASLSAGSGHTVAVTTDGRLHAWGYDGYGQLGDGAVPQRPAPVLIGSGYAFVATGQAHTVAVTTGGELYAWGSNGYGQLGDGTTSPRSFPTLIGSGFASAAAGAYHTVALTTDGRLFAWGYNSYGQLGDGSTAQRLTPTLIGSGYASAAAGDYHTVAITTGGDLYAWGYNSAGQLGDGTTTQRLVPTLIGSGWASAAAGVYHTVAIKTGGNLYAWGANYNGQLGDGTTTQRLAPTLIGSGYASAAAGGAGSGGSHTVAVTTGGQLHAWGANGAGQLGDGSTTQRLTPTLVGSGYASASAGGSGLIFGAHTVAITTGGQLHAWGINNNGQLGDGTTTQRLTPTLVGSGFASVAAARGYDSACTVAITTGGQLYAWGGDVYGQLGDGHGTRQTVPREVSLMPGPDYLAYAPTVATYAAGGAIAANVPTWSGTATSFSVTPALPAGLVLDPVTGVVSGTPSSTSPTASYAVTATGPAGSTTGLLTITVN